MTDQVIGALPDEKDGVAGNGHRFSGQDFSKVRGGALYLNAASAIAWFREDFPMARFVTKFVTLGREEQPAMEAEVWLDGQMVANAFKLVYPWAAERTEGESHQQAINRGVNDLGIEKSETQAVARALGRLGYGTLAAVEEWERGGSDPHDTPVRPSGQRKPPKRRQNDGLWAKAWEQANWSSEDWAMLRKATYDMFSDRDDMAQAVLDSFEDGALEPGMTVNDAISLFCTGMTITEKERGDANGNAETTAGNSVEVEG